MLLTELRLRTSKRTRGGHRRGQLCCRSWGTDSTGQTADSWAARGSAGYLFCVQTSAGYLFCVQTSAGYLFCVQQVTCSAFSRLPVLGSEFSRRAGVAAAAYLAWLPTSCSAISVQPLPSISCCRPMVRPCLWAACSSVSRARDVTDGTTRPVSVGRTEHGDGEPGVPEKRNQRNGTLSK